MSPDKLFIVYLNGRRIRHQCWMKPLNTLSSYNYKFRCSVSSQIVVCFQNISYVEEIFKLLTLLKLLDYFHILKNNFQCSDFLDECM